MMSEQKRRPSPTSGWMRSELERHGVRNRGIAYTDAQLAAMLREIGIDVSHKPARKEESTSGDR